MHIEPDSVWIIAREYAGIAEAGGVKNVVCSLAEALCRAGKKTTVFIPRYGCAHNCSQATLLFVEDIVIDTVSHRTGFYELILHGVRIILLEATVYSSKHGVYIYTDEDKIGISGASRGKGHFDADIMNLLLQNAVLRFARVTNSVPDILHCQDAHTALLPALIRTDPRQSALFENTGIVVTIHNAGPGYRQIMSDSEHTIHLTGLTPTYIRRGVYNGHFEPFLLASSFSTLTTVSPWYADEITNHRYTVYTDGLSAEFERRRVMIHGITNGIDFDKYNPLDTHVSMLPNSFNPEAGDLEGKYRCRDALLDSIRTGISVPGIHSSGSIDDCVGAVYFGYHGRIATQKGIDVLLETVQRVCTTNKHARFLILGQGEPVLEDRLVQLTALWPGRVVYMRGYERSLARLFVAAADFLVLPSLFEPCGLEDLIGQIFGTIPVAHAVGGLQKIEDTRTGFLYHSCRESSDAEILAEKICTLIQNISDTGVDRCAQVPLFLHIIKIAAEQVRTRYNWDRIVYTDYLPLYRQIRSGEA